MVKLNENARHKGNQGCSLGCNCMRRLVSVNKKRTEMGGFDLDLMYITDRVAAIGFPAEGVESAYRNARQDVINFFKRHHGKNVKIYNLCCEASKQYP